MAVRKEEVFLFPDIYAPPENIAPENVTEVRVQQELQLRQVAMWDFYEDVLHPLLVGGSTQVLQQYGDSLVPSAGNERGPVHTVTDRITSFALGDLFAALEFDPGAEVLVTRMQHTDLPQNQARLSFSLRGNQEDATRPRIESVVELAGQGRLAQISRALTFEVVHPIGISRIVQSGRRLI